MGNDEVLRGALRGWEGLAEQWWGSWGGEGAVRTKGAVGGAQEGNMGGPGGAVRGLGGSWRPGGQLGAGAAV